MSGIPEVPQGFIIVERHDGIMQRMGKSAGVESNWYYDILDQEGKECILMFCRNIRVTRTKKRIRQTSGNKLSKSELSDSSE
jgi:hypothetical protein